MHYRSLRVCQYPSSPHGHVVQNARKVHRDYSTCQTKEKRYIVLYILFTKAKYSLQSHSSNNGTSEHAGNRSTNLDTSVGGDLEWSTSRRLGRNISCSETGVSTCGRYSEDSSRRRDSSSANNDRRNARSWGKTNGCGSGSSQSWCGSEGDLRNCYSGGEDCYCAGRWDWETGGWTGWVGARDCVGLCDGDGGHWNDRWRCDWRDRCNS